MAENPGTVGDNVDECKVPCNEEIINELTKGLDATNIEKERENCGKDYSLDTKGCSEEDIYINNAETDSRDRQGVEDGVLETEDIKDEDFIDEEALKDRELTLDEEDKQRLRGEAEVHKSKGNELFKAGNFQESTESYTLALRTCPLAFEKDRAVMYSNRAAAKMKLNLKPSAIDDCSKAIELDSGYIKAYFRRAQMYEETEKLDEALADYQKILELEPLHREALYASKRLPEQIHERNEKMKTEMLAKLKDLGNMILRPFGLSTDNFQVTQDPNSGGYSVNFSQAPK